MKLIMSENPMVGLVMMQKMGLLSHIGPALENMVGVSQETSAHKYDVFEHSLRALQHAADKGILPLPTVEETKLNFAISRNFSLIFGHLMSVIEAKVTGNLIMNIEQEKTFESCSKEVFETMKTITNIYPTVNYNRSNRMTINPGQTITTGGLNQYTPVAGPVSGVSVKR